MKIIPFTQQKGSRLDANAQSLLKAWVDAGMPDTINGREILNKAAIGMDGVTKAISDLYLYKAIEVKDDGPTLTKYGAGLVKRMEDSKEVSPADQRVQEFAEAIIDKMNELTTKLKGSKGKRTVTPAVLKLVKARLNEPCPVPDEHGNQQEWRISHFTEVLRYKAELCASDNEFHDWKYFRPSTILNGEVFYKHLDTLIAEYANQ